MSFTPGGPLPNNGIAETSPDVDMEKSHPIVGHRGSDDVSANDRDIDGEKVQDFQRGVERVRVITTIWDKPTLISMFIL